MNVVNMGDSDSYKLNFLQAISPANDLSPSIDQYIQSCNYVVEYLGGEAKFLSEQLLKDKIRNFRSNINQTIQLGKAKLYLLIIPFFTPNIELTRDQVLEDFYLILTSDTKYLNAVPKEIWEQCSFEASFEKSTLNMLDAEEFTNFRANYIRVFNAQRLVFGLPPLNI